MQLLSHTALSLLQLSSAHTTLCKRQWLILTQDQERQRAKDWAARTSRSICSSPFPSPLLLVKPTNLLAVRQLRSLAHSPQCLLHYLRSRSWLGGRLMKRQLNLNVTAFLTEEEAKTGVQRLMGMHVGQCGCGLFHQEDPSFKIVTHPKGH